MASLLSLIPKREYYPSADIFDRFFDDFYPLSVFREGDEWVPAFDINENEKEYVVTAELPGMEAKDIDVTLSDGILSVKGEKKREHEEKGENYHRIERSYGSFNRSFSIPGKVKMDSVDANYKDGILRLILPKTEEGESKKIEVK
ncbi:MAG: Hsp20/alpha crystallin family protein [Deltaproteobacteria bacterium]|nr:Hsp20/alpha crystallin family protein [Deltaproteobacteria bacterium]